MVMFRLMVAPWRDASPYLGVGTYYLRADENADSQKDGLVNVTLESPLILNGRQVRMLIRKYGTDSSDQMTALAGAWTLRREILQMGHDGIIAIGSSLNEAQLMLVALGRASDKPRDPAPRDDTRSRAAIARLAVAEVVAP